MCQFFALVETAHRPPLSADGHGQHRVNALMGQPIGRIVAHDLGKQGHEGAVAVMFPLLQGLGQGNLVVGAAPFALPEGVWGVNLLAGAGVERLKIFQAA